MFKEHSQKSLLFYLLFSIIFWRMFKINRCFLKRGTLDAIFLSEKLLKSSRLFSLLQKADLFYKYFACSSIYTATILKLWSMKDNLNKEEIEETLEMVVQGEIEFEEMVSIVKTVHFLATIGTFEKAAK